MKNYRHSVILDRSFNLLTKLRSVQFKELPKDIQMDWLEKIWLELFGNLIKPNHSHSRVILHFALGSVLAIGNELDIQEPLIAKLESQNRAKRSIRCYKTLGVYLYLKRLANKLTLNEKQFLENYRKIQLGALYVLVSAPENEALTNEVLNYLRHDFWLTKSTAEELVNNYVPKTNLIGSNFWVRKSQSGGKWTIPYKKLGEKIKYLRSECCQISQSELGEMIGLSTISVFHLEKGDRKIDVIELWLVAREFADKSNEFKLLSECLGEILEKQPEKGLYLDSNKLSQKQTDLISQYFSRDNESFELKSTVRQAINLISVNNFSKTSRITANPKCGIEPYKRLGEKVKALRTQNGISRSQFSKQAGIAWIAVFHLERGDRRMDVAELWATSKIFAGNSGEFLVLLKCLEKMFN
jgi:DNA-binding XRE family transcriptional regulator